MFIILNIPEQKYFDYGSFVMFIIRHIPEQKYFADVKPVTVTTDPPDLSDSVT